MKTTARTPAVSISKVYVELAKAGYNPLVSIHFKGLPRAKKVQLYDAYYRKERR